MRAWKASLIAASCAAFAACGFGGTPDGRLLEAAKRGDRREINRLIADGAKIETRDDDGWTPLLWAAAHGNEDTVGALIDAGADKTAVTPREKQNALVLAAKWNRVEVVAELLKRGVPARQRDGIGWTPLMWAALKGRTDVAAKLLDGGADVETTDSDGNRPLILAARQGRTDTVKLLLAHGARAGARNAAGDTAESLARAEGYHEVADLIKAR